MNNNYNDDQVNNISNQPIENSQPVNNINNQPMNNVTTQLNTKTVGPGSYFDDVSKKKNSKLLIIIITIILLIVSGIIIFFVFGNTFSKQGSNNDSSVDSKDNISQIGFWSNGIVVLSSNGKMYAIGETGGVCKDSSTKKPILLANDVKSFKLGGNYYLDNNGTLYKKGLDYDGGCIKEYTKVADDVIEYDAFSNFCEAYVNKDGDAYISNGNFGSIKDRCGLSGKDPGTRKIASGVKSVFTTFDAHGYINDNNELYIMVRDDKEYHKAFDNVASVYSSMSNIIILTVDNKLYSLEFYEGNSTLLAENVKEYGNNFYISRDGKTYMYFYEYTAYIMPYNNNSSNSLKESEYFNDQYDVDKSGYYQVDFKSPIKKLYYMDKGNIVYLTDKNKIYIFKVLEESKSDAKEKLLDNKISSLKDLYELIKKKS